MDTLYWDAVVRGGAGALLVLMAVAFARDWRGSLTARLGMALTLAGVAYLIVTALPPSSSWLWWRLLLQILSISAPGLFWLFVESWFDDEFELRWFHGAVLILMVTPGVLNTCDCGFGLFGGLNSLVSLLAIGLGLWAALRGRNGDLVESRRRARLVLAIAVGGAIAVILLSEASLRRWPLPPLWRLIDTCAILVLASGLTVSLLGWRDRALLSAPTRAKPGLAVEPDEAPLLAAVEALMRHERLYRQDRLTVAAVASRLGVPEYRLRRAINQGSGARNFNAFLNRYRLQEVQDALIDPAQREVSILTMALDSGFGSLAPFNRAFKAATGQTPTAYRVSRHTGA